MHLAAASRGVAGLAVLAVAFTTMSIPAEASEAAPHSGARIARALTEVQNGKALKGSVETDLEDIANVVCVKSASVFPAANLVNYTVVESATDVGALVISADVTVPGGTETCTFAAILGDGEVPLEGSFTFDVYSEDETPESRTGAVSGPVTLIDPVFSDVAFWAEAEIASSGNAITMTPKSVTTKVTTAKTAKQKRAAKKKFNAKVKSAKKAYKKAGKTKKAKKAMNKKIAAAKKAYKKAIAPSTKTVTRTVPVRTATPYSLSGSLTAPVV